MEELTIDQIREIQLDILSEVDDFCVRNSLRYSLGFGTLLGAVRHEGYIPWDDDIDILMPRNDYVKFIEIFNKTNYDVKSHYRDEMYPYPYAKVSDERTRIIENTSLKYNRGVNIDVFPLDIFLENEYFIKKIHRKSKIYNTLLYFKKFSVNSQRKLYKNLILKAGKILLKPIHYKKIINKIDMNAQTHINKINTGMKGCMVDSYSKNDIMKTNIFIEQTLLNFEGREYYAPKDYHTYLTNIYGDYLKLPSKEERKTHHEFAVFWL